MKLKITIFLALTFVLSNLTFSQNYAGDLIFWKRNGLGFTIHLKVHVFSVPFEGMTYIATNIYNRQDQLQNGIKFRHFGGTTWPPLPQNITEWPLTYYESISPASNGPDDNILDLGHCAAGEVPHPSVDGAWGYAIYEITIHVDESEEDYYFYWDCLDSKYGKRNWFGENQHYGKDWFIEFIGTEPKYNRVKIRDADNSVIPHIVTTSDHSMYKVWQLINPELTGPFEQNFQARTTPFPIHPQMLANHYDDFKELILGTIVTLDNVYNNEGDLDKYGYNTVDYFYSPNVGLRKYYSEPPIDGENIPGKTFCTPAYGDFTPIPATLGMTIIAQTGNKMIIKNDKRLWITGLIDPNDPLNYIGDVLKFEGGSILEKETNAQINTCRGGKLIDYGATTSWGLGSIHKAYAHSSIEYYGSEHVVSNGEITILGDAKLILGDNTTLVFNGEHAKLSLDPYSTVVFGNNAKIKFTNGARILACSTLFCPSNQSVYWEGLVFENAGANYGNIITHSTFSNARNPISFNNTEQTAFYNLNLVSDNDFNISVSDGKAVYAKNVYRLWCNENRFNLVSGAYGVFIQNYNNPVSEAPEGNPVVTDINLSYNVFNGGSIQLFIGGYASVNIPVYVYDNTFTNGGWCFAGRMITGNLKYNTMSNSSSNYTIGLWQSNPNLYENNMSNQNGSTMSLNLSSPIISPVVNDQNQLVWYGGYNYFTAHQGDNVHFISSNPNIEHGYNCFAVSNPSYYHLYGSVSTSGNEYYGRRNAWSGNGNNPKAYLYKADYTPVQLIYQPVINCNQEGPYISYILNDLANGIFDTIWVSDNTGDPAPIDEVLYAQAMEYYGNAQYFDAITNFKNLIDNYSSSNYLLTSLTNLYACYEGLDTSDQNHRDLIFSELKNYFQQKIEQYWYNVDFVNTAYNLILMCESKIENYNDAMTGYEFIALYHPDPDARMWASMDYGYIQELLNEGGSESSAPKKNAKVSILKLMDKKPYTKIVKDLFVKGNKKLEKEINSDAVNTDKSLYHKKEMVERARQNISISRSLTKQQKEERRMEDIKMLIKDEGNNSNENMNIIPKSYSLHQNYPNPFNPVTTIKYELPNDGLISLKIYDILGREIYSINEFKKAGVYDLKFDGTNFASGVYFYRLESGSFAETRKMVLMK